MLLESPTLRAACDRCHKRKQRCMRPPTGDDNIPCRRCKEAGEKCVFSPPCRLGRPSNKSRKQRQHQCNDESTEKDDISTSSSPVLVPSTVGSKSDSSANTKCRDSPRARITESKFRIRQPGRPRRPRNPQSTPPLGSPNSTVSVPNALEEKIASKASATPPGRSLNVFTGNLQDTTISLQQASAEPQDQNHHINFPTTIPPDTFLATQNNRSAVIQPAEIDSHHRIWNSSVNNTFSLESGHTVGDTLQYHQQIPLPNMLSMRPDPQYQPQQLIASKETQLRNPITPTSDSNRSTWSDISMNPQTKPLTPPPLLPHGTADPARDGTDGSMHPGLIYMPVDTYNPGNPWFTDINEPYHTFNDKSAEEAIITATALIQNYHLQLQLMSTGNPDIMEGDGNWSRHAVYQ